MVTPDVVAVDEGTLTLEVTCFQCGKPHRFQVTEEGYDKRMNGGKVQDCFPELKPAVRELMVTGICPKCFDDMFAPDPDEPDEE